MKSLYLSLIFIISSYFSNGQVFEDFSDNEFSQNPVWHGETGYFTINNVHQLQSNGPSAASQLHLSTANSFLKNTCWGFYIKLDFDITTSNWAKVYLTSDRIDTELYPKGYYVKFDGTTNSVDLYKQDSTKHTKLIAGKQGRAGSAISSHFLIKVISDNFGNWHLFSDSTATGDFFFKEGHSSDASFTTSHFFGVNFSHTTTRRTGFYFDNLSISEAPLSLLKAIPISSTCLKLNFNKNLDKPSVENILNYHFKFNHLIVSTIVWNENDSSSVFLYLSSSMNTYTTYEVTANGIVDESGNAIGLLNSAEFKFRINAHFGDIVITELFPDPTPRIDLPDAEFVELYNRLNDSLDVTDFVLSDGSYNAIFPNYKIPPHQYLIICATNTSHLFSDYQSVLSLTNFPSLNNLEDRIKLMNQNGHLIHQVNYNDSWYRDNDKKTGGWTLESIDLDNPCGEENNWQASMNVSGGTPGKQNSIAAFKPDIQAPQLLNAYIIDSCTVELIFDENPDMIFVNDFKFSLNPFLLVSEVNVKMNNAKILQLKIVSVFKKNTEYTLFISGVKDCNGNSITPIYDVLLVLPQLHEKDDVIINEVLFNPKPGGFDFVEVYNRSEKYINLQNWAFATISDEQIADKKNISEEPFIVKPKEYIVFTKNKSMLLHHYPQAKSSQIFNITNLPSYNDDNGSVVFCDYDTNEMERLDYDTKMHFSLMDDKEGVSLERISADGRVNNRDNWHSASSNSGYATPGYRNSQDVEKTSRNFFIEPKVFTPNLDGNRDFTLIHYRLGKPGYMASITIYDIQGREIIRLVKNELLSVEGFYKWEGNNDANEKVRTGTYIVYFEIFDLEGNLIKQKDTVVVGWSN